MRLASSRGWWVRKHSPATHHRSRDLNLIARLLSKPSKRLRELTGPLSQALLETFLASIAPSPQWAVQFV